MNTMMQASGLSERTGPEFKRTADHPETLANYIMNLVAVNPDGEFIAVDRYGRQSSVTFREMLERACAIVRQLPMGAPHRYHVAVLCFNDILDYIGSAWACLLTGIDILPLDTASAFTNPSGFRHELRQAVNYVGSESLVLADSETCRAIGRTDEELVAKIIDVSSAYVSRCNTQFGDSGRVSRASNLLISTSGTGGRAKIAVLDNRSVTNRFFDGAQPDQRVCLYNLAHHSVGGVRLLLPIGQRVIYLHPLRLAADPRDWFRTIARFTVTDVGVSSSMAAILCEAGCRNTPDFSVASLKRVSFGAEVIVPRVIKQFMRALQAHGSDETLVSLVYSMTETGPIYRSILPYSDLLKQLESGTEAIALTDCVPGWTVRCVDDLGCVLPESQLGTIHVRSESKLFAGYYGEQGNARQDSWFNTGDVGAMVNGKLTLKGREKSTIIVNARKITCEQVEACLALHQDLAGTTIIAAPYRESDQVTDEIAIFFVSTRDALSNAKLSSLITATISKRFRLSVKHVVPVAEFDVERTATMKVRRDALVQKYKNGSLANGVGSAPQKQNQSRKRALLKLWQEALELSECPQMDDSFFDLGGDSLAGARLIAGVEAAFAAQIETDEFFCDPSPRRLLSLLNGGSAKNGFSLRSGEGAALQTSSDVLRGVAAHVCSWSGEKLLGNSLLTGFNTAGRQRPIFWVFQSYKEARGLAHTLGPNQPLYAMRSAAGVISTEEYSEDRLGVILDRYLRELLTLSEGGAFSLGGNCQGAIIAFFLARRLQAMGREPSPLYLLDWSFDHGVYRGPTEILLREDSHFWSELDKAEFANRLRANFPLCSVHTTPLHHGNFLLRARWAVYSLRKTQDGERVSALMQRLEQSKRQNERRVSALKHLLRKRKSQNSERVKVLARRLEASDKQNKKLRERVTELRERAIKLNHKQTLTWLMLQRVRKIGARIMSGFSR